MSAGWVAASVRVRALAAGRAGEEGAERLASVRTWREAEDLLARWSYGTRAAEASSPEALQRAARETLLWQLRVLAGWAPAAGTGILRAAAARFERDNILGHVRELEGGSAADPYDLGAMETSWSLLRRAESPDRLRDLLARTAWGEVPEDEADQLADLLTVSWLTRYAQVAPAARTWCARDCALTIARLRFAQGRHPGPAVRQRVGPLLGHAWEQATDLRSFAAALPAGARSAFGDLASPAELWRAEARTYAAMDSEATAMLRQGTPGPDVVVAGIALLAADAWRVQAAIASIGQGRAAREVLDVAS
ncbi:V-type ATPase subunit [Demequina salsinemoris]|uniref:V-type ATPase subunit n=1 Tax=Demequina salsinemoris TaxID=577470 RepID=UPI000A80D942|nr:V-type ATPase subunit [Demequina salsinemoris]